MRGIATGLGMMLIAGAAQAAPVNLLTNGSFENGPDNGSFQQVNAFDSTTIPGWTVESGSVDYINTYWVSQDGSHSIDMSGSNAGTLSQGFSTTFGQMYNVSFYIAGNPDGGNPTKTMTAMVLSGTDPTYTFNTSGFSTGNMGWTKQGFSFMGTGFDTLVFTSMDDNAFGMALDNVSVVAAVPLPASAPLFGAALLALGAFGYGLKRRKAAAAA